MHSEDVIDTAHAQALAVKHVLSLDVLCDGDALLHCLDDVCFALKLLFHIYLAPSCYTECQSGTSSGADGCKRSHSGKLPIFGVGLQGLLVD